MSGTARFSSLYAVPRVPLRLLRPLAVPAASALFVFTAVLALQVAPVGSSVQINEGRVVSVAEGSQAWLVGVRPGWWRAGGQEGSTIYTNGADYVPVPNRPTDVPLVPTFTPSLVALAASGIALVARSRRLAATLGVLGATLAIAPLDPLGRGAIALAWPPALIALYVAWSMWPRRGRVSSERRMLRLAGAASFVAVLAFSAWRASTQPFAAAAVLYVLAAWALVVASIVGEARADGLGPRGVTRELAIELVPFAGRIQQRAAQAERDRLASDLHAEVLPAIASTAAALEQEGAVDAATRLRDLAVDVRGLVSQRRLPILEQEGLVPAAEWLAESLEDRSDLRIEIDLAGYEGERQPIVVERAAYRILQLALDNVIKHAEATAATIAISGDRDKLELAVSDDGRGIRAGAAERATHAGHLGVSDMRTEAAAIGGALTVAPGREGGTVVRLKWPA